MVGYETMTENTWPGWRPGCFVHQTCVCACGNHNIITIGPVVSNAASFLDGEALPRMRSKLGGWIGLFDGAYVPPEPPELRVERPSTAGRPAVPTFRREPRRNPRSASRRGKVEAAP